MKNITSYILSLIVAICVFNLYFILTGFTNYSFLYLTKLIINNHSNLFLELSLVKFQITYPRYGSILFVIVQLYKLKFFFYIFLITFIINKLYSNKKIKKKFLFTFLLSFITLMFIELCLIVVKPNNNQNENFLTFLQASDLELLHLTNSDKHGINLFTPEADKILPGGYKTNKEGFRSNYEFDSLSLRNLKKNNNLLMFVGDSYTEGCCATPIRNSFVDLLDSKKNIASLNFGIGGTDPLQYSLIVKHYLKNIHPDILIIPLCLSNDFMKKDRKPMPEKSLYFQTNYKYIQATLPESHPNYKNDTYFENWAIAKKYYLDKYSIYGSEYSILNKHLITHSAFYERIYLLIYNYNKEKPPFIEPTKASNNKTTYKYLKQIKNTCDSLSIPFLLIGTPSINDLDKNIELVNTNYRSQLNELEIHIPTNFIESDYISFQNDHFNNTGHQKFADYLTPIIDSTLNYQTFSKSDTLN
jgi:hypothetical protein